DRLQRATMRPVYARSETELTRRTPESEAELSAFRIDPQRHTAALPQAQPAGKRIIVISEPLVVGELLQAPGVAATHHHIVNFERSAQLIDDLAHHLAPFAGPHPQPPALSNIVLVSPAMFVGHVADLHRLDVARDDQSGTEAGTQPEKQHP